MDIHDKSYKDLFSTKDTFLSLLNTFVQGDWVDKLDADNVIFYVLLELQSSVDNTMPIRLLMYMVELWRDVLRNSENREIRRKDYRLPAIVPIVLYNGRKKWTCARCFKDIINESQLFGDNILDFKYVLVDINRYSKDYLYEFKNIAAAIFLLDQDIDAMEFLQRLKDIVVNFSKLTAEQKLLLKGWIKNTTNNNEVVDMNTLVENIFNNENEGVTIMVSNASNIFTKLKNDAIKEGEAKGKSDLLITQLTKKFHGLTDYYLNKIKKLPEETIELIATDIFDLEKIEDIDKYL